MTADRPGPDKAVTVAAGGRLLKVTAPGAEYVMVEDAGPGATHDCSTCPDCVHDGQECCGCYDGACCKPPGPGPARDENATLRDVIYEAIRHRRDPRDPEEWMADSVAHGHTRAEWLGWATANEVADVLAPHVTAQVDTASCPACAGAMPTDQMGAPLQAAHTRHTTRAVCPMCDHAPHDKECECGCSNFTAQVSDTDAERSWHEVALVATAGESRAEHERDEARAQVAERDAEIAWWKGACAEAEVRYIDAEADRDAALARVDAARRDALTGANRAAVEMLADLAGLMNDHRDAAILCEAAANLSEVKP